MGKNIKCDGSLCDEVEFCCDSIGPNLFYCTRRKGHTGPHIACTNEDHNLDIWENNEEEE
jgi:hypothetical protein